VVFLQAGLELSLGKSAATRVLVDPASPLLLLVPTGRSFARSDNASAFFTVLESTLEPLEATSAGSSETLVFGNPGAFICPAPFVADAIKVVMPVTFLVGIHSTEYVLRDNLSYW
jgi:hypothetical protein